MIEHPVTRRRLLQSSAATALGFYLAGCGGDDDGSGTGTLTVWDSSTEANKGFHAAYETLNKRFEEANPGTTIDRVVKGYDDLQEVAPRALAGPQGPNVAQIIQGRSSLGPLVLGDHILALRDYADDYGWADRWPSSVTATSTFEPGTENMGTGSLYGVSNTTQIGGLFYNQEILDKYKIPIPETFAELQQALVDVKDAGEVPIYSPGRGNETTWQVLFFTMVSREWVDAIFSLNPHESFDIPEATEASTILLDWFQSDNFAPGYEGLAVEEAHTLFGQGNGAFLVDGSWASATIKDNAEDPEVFGFELLPSASGVSGLTMGDWAEPFVVKAGTGQEDLDVAYVDQMTGEEAMRLMMKIGEIPSWIPPDPPPTGRLQGDLLASLERVLDENKLGSFLDLAWPEAYQTLYATISALIGGELSPEEVGPALDDSYQAFYETAAT